MIDLYESGPRADVDMSAQAITVRLKRVSQLRKLCLSLGKAQLEQPRAETPGKQTIDAEQQGPNS